MNLLTMFATANIELEEAFEKRWKQEMLGTSFYPLVPKDDLEFLYLDLVELTDTFAFRRTVAKYLSFEGRQQGYRKAMENETFRVLVIENPDHFGLMTEVVRKFKALLSVEEMIWLMHCSLEGVAFDGLLVLLSAPNTTVTTDSVLVIEGTVIRTDAFCKVIKAAQGVDINVHVKHLKEAISELG